MQPGVFLTGKEDEIKSKDADGYGGTADLLLMMMEAIARIRINDT